MNDAHETLTPFSAEYQSRGCCSDMRQIHLPLALCLALLASPVPAADYALGLIAFDRGDIASAQREFSALAAQGHPAAQYSLAMLYLKSAPPEYARAIPWLEKSAGRGYPNPSTCSACCPFTASE